MPGENLRTVRFTGTLGDIHYSEIYETELVELVLEEEGGKHDGEILYATPSLLKIEDETVAKLQFKLFVSVSQYGVKEDTHPDVSQVITLDAKFTHWEYPDMASFALYRPGSSVELGAILLRKDRLPASGSQYESIDELSLWIQDAAGLSIGA
ncbi:hypothetical protein [Haloarchaeobius sp. DFWS5]|uniref:hypothetical protein n=1 Tax=Haloarchaeobius sp. DFWS5 TaxID=3446114 RepID=UPI003EBEF5BF